MKKVLFSILLVTALAFLVCVIPASALTDGDFTYSVVSGKAVITAYNGNDKVVNVPEKLGSYSVYKIGSSAFKGNKAITSVTVNGNVTSIDDSAFENCTSLAKITLPSTVSHIGKKAVYNTAFYNNKNNWKQIAPTSSGDVSIESSVEQDTVLWEDICAKNLDYLYLGTCLIEATLDGTYSIKKGTTVIAEYAFSGVKKATSIEIPSSVIGIGSFAFKGCTGLTEIEVSSYNKHYKSVDGVLFSKDSTTLICYPAQKDSSTYTVSGNVRKIENYAFEACNLDRVAISASVSSIGSSAFSNANDDLVIRAYTGTYAETYAKNKGIEFSSFGSIPSSKTGLYKVGAVWCYVKNGAVNYDFTGFAKHTDGSLYYIEDGVHNSSYTGLVNHTGCILYYVNKGIVDNTKTGNVKHTNGKTYSVKDGVVKLEHNFSDSYTVDKNATCTKDGSKSRHCTRCGVKTSITKISAKGHKYGSWVVTKKATTSASGSQTRTCSACGVKQTQTIAQLKCSKPTLNSASNTSIGVKLSWAKTTGADSYRVYRKTGSGSYVRLTETTSLSFTDKTAKSGVKYSYYIRAFNEAGYSVMSNVLTKYYLDAPVMKSATNTSSGVKVSWSKIDGAAGYKVYRKTSDGWKYLGKTTNTYFTNTSVKSGTTYTYTVRAYYGDYVSTYFIKGITKTYIADPELKTASNTTSGIKLTWSKVTGATSYRVYRKTGSGSYTRIAETKNLYYTDKTAKSGVKYTYYVRAFIGSGYSAVSNTLVKWYLADTTLMTPTSTKSGISLKWSKVSGADGYIIYRKTGSGSYVKLKTEVGASNLSYVDKTAKKGVKYTYKIKAYKGSKTYSTFSNTKTITDKY